MNFLEIKDNIEAILSRQQIQSQLLELHYLAYLFGSGFVAYRINGVNFRFAYDGRDGILTIDKTKMHEKYSQGNWEVIFEGKLPESLEDFQHLVLSLTPLNSENVSQK